MSRDAAAEQDDARPLPAPRWVPERLLDGLDDIERWRVGGALTAMVTDDPEAVAAFVRTFNAGERRSLQALVQQWVPLIAADVDEAEPRLVVMLAGVRIAAQASGWVTDDEVIAWWCDTGDPVAVFRMVSERLREIGAINDQLNKVAAS